MIGKYNFNSKEQVLSKIDALGIGIDEDGNEYPNHNHTIVLVGYIVKTAGEYDVDGIEITPAIFSDKFSVDTIWSDGETPYGWKTYEIDVDTPIHTFF